MRYFWRAAFSVRRVEAAKPYNSAVAQFNIEAFIDADRFNRPGGAPASREARGGENDGRERRASAAEPPGAGE